MSEPTVVFTYNGGGEMEPRAATEEKICRALAQAIQTAYDQTGIQVEQCTFEWREEAHGFLMKTVLKRTSIKTNLRTREPFV